MPYAEYLHSFTIYVYCNDFSVRTVSDALSSFNINGQCGNAIFFFPRHAYALYQRLQLHFIYYRNLKFHSNKLIIRSLTSYVITADSLTLFKNLPYSADLYVHIID